jgi:hypothetical protein
MDIRERLALVGSSKPVDRATARVMQRGVHHELPDEPQAPIWDSPPAMVYPLPAGVPNLIGRRVGRMIVVGLMKRTPERKSSVGLWVVRCVCGRYTGRRAKTISRNHDDECCDHCDYMEGLRTGHTRYGLKSLKAQDSL